MINIQMMGHPQKKIEFSITILYLEELVAFTEVSFLSEFGQKNLSLF